MCESERFEPISLVQSSLVAFDQHDALSSIMHCPKVKRVLFQLQRSSKRKDINIPSEQTQFAAVLIFPWDLDYFCMNNIHYLFNPLARQPSGAPCNLQPDPSLSAKNRKFVHGLVTSGISRRAFQSLFPCLCMSSCL